jgi:hypothetical protein
MSKFTINTDTDVEIEDDLHDRLVKAFIEYSAYSSRFELFGYQTSAVGARNALTKITQIAKERRKEIWEKRVSVHGHHRKGIAPVTPDDRRKRKLARKQAKLQNQNQQANSGTDNI